MLVVLRALGLGDFLTGLPALRSLARAYPDHRRILAAPITLRPLAMMSGAIDDVVDVEPLAGLPPALRGADIAVNLHGRGPQSHRVLLAGRPGRLIAFRRASVPETARSPGWRPREHEVARWCRMLAGHGIPTGPDRLELEIDPAAAPAAARGATLVHPGAASEARRWPPLRWVELIGTEHMAGRRVVLTGGAGEVRLARGIAADAGIPENAVLAGRTDLPGLAAAVAAADRVVCGDTGVGHLATAVGTPSVLLFGPTSPAEWGPPADRRQHTALWAGRSGDPHATTTDPGLLAITVARVRQALDELPARTHPAPPVEPGPPPAHAN